MKSMLTFKGLFVIFMGMLIGNMGMLNSVAAGEQTKAEAMNYCPCCMMLDAEKAELSEETKTMVRDAGISDEMIAQGQALINASLYMDSPSVLLGRAKTLGLTDAQKEELIDIEKQARKKAAVVLNQSQKDMLGEITEQPVTVKEHMIRMHRKMGPVMCKRIKEGKDIYMGCPMMMEGIREPGITKDELADAIEAYVKEKSESHGGYFVVFDEKADKELKLTLDRVHREKLSKVGCNHYFACADFKTPEGKIYDLDIFMTGTNKDDLTFSKFAIHKEAGKERYTWYETDGIWKKKVVDESVEGHPKEHPRKPRRDHPREHPR